MCVAAGSGRTAWFLGPKAPCLAGRVGPRNGKGPNMDKPASLIPSDRIEQAILLIRGQKVMLDKDLASMYRVATKVLVQAVKRNHKRFPADFMFQLSKEELEQWRSQIVTSNPRARMGLR